MLEIFICFCVGLLVGSFLNVVILRLPEEEGLNGRSRCPRCKHTLAAKDLVPLFSFIFLLGRCRYCRRPISPRYFIIEMVTALLFAWAGLLFPVGSLLGGLVLAKTLMVIAVLVAVFVIDLEHFLILDEIVLSGSITSLAFNVAIFWQGGWGFFNWVNPLVSGVLAAASLTLPLYALWFFSSGRALGFGDVKLAVFLGLALGWPLAGVGLFMAIILGGVVSTVLLASKSKTLKSRVPFGTFLAVGMVTSLFYGEKFLNWYLVWLGF